MSAGDWLLIVAGGCAGAVVALTLWAMCRLVAAAINQAHHCPTCGAEYGLGAACDECIELRTGGHGG